MATLTYDPTPADQPEFSEEELDSLQVGEQQQQEEERAYAGKFKDAEALEQAYIELQRKLGESDDETPDESVRDEEETAEEEVELSEADQLVLNAADEYYKNEGKLSEETIEQLTSMESSDLVEAYLRAQANAPAPEGVDLSAEETQAIKNVAGGDEAYGELIEWAGSNMPEQVIEGFDQLVDAGNPVAIQLAVRGLMAEYEAANGMEGEMLSGKTAPNKVDTFRSQAEVVEAMSDPRYDKDPAYRQDVFMKLERSNLEY